MASEITKQKAGKRQWGLILQHIPNALEAMVKVREYGNTKYRKIAEDAGVPFDSESWRDNDAETYLESAFRHLMAVYRGERVNHEDGGVEHLAQAMIDLGFALEIERQGGPRPSPRSDAYLWADGGKHLNLVVTSPQDLPSLEDTVEAISRIKRWAGHCENAISVARHSVLVARIMQAQITPSDAEVRACLLHDLHEALYGDTPTPLKRLERSLGDRPVDKLVAQFDAALEQRYGVNLGYHYLKHCDAVAGAIEAMARDVGDAELEAWYDRGVLAEARGLAPQFELHLAAWPPEDDAARWWSMWTLHGGELHRGQKGL